MSENPSDWLKDLLNPLGFENLTAGPSEEQKEALERMNQEREQFAQDVAATFTSAPGKRVMKALREMTIESSTWKPSLGMKKGVPHGFAREGQNALVRWLEDTIKAGTTRKPTPKKKD